MLTRKMIVGMIMAVLATMGTAAWGIDYFVDPSGDNSDGLSWATAFHTIQQGIDANDPTVVDVNEGTYYETIDFNGVSCIVTSTDPNNWDMVEATIIDANGAGRVVTFDDNEDANCILTGFTITGGYVSGTGDGGGIYCEGSSPTISKCVIQYNYAADDGGGIFCYDSSSPSISYCRITDNGAGCGGGMYNYFSDPVLTNCIFSENSSGTDAGGMNNYCSGPTLTNCIFSDNSATYGGGILNYYCNSDSGIPTVINCTFSGNSASSDGGGMYNYYSTPILTNCIFWGDTADTSGDEIYNYSSDPNISYCDINECKPGGVWDPNFGTDCGGNISSYPYFADYEGNDFHLTWNSPCINRGDPNGDYTGEKDIDGEPRVADEEFVDERVDMGADELNLANINLVKNPGFEDGVDENGMPLHWTKSGCTEPNILVSSDSNEAHLGNSLKIYHDGSVTSGYPLVLSDWIAVKPGEICNLSAWVKCDLGTEEILLFLTECDANLVYVRNNILNANLVPGEWIQLTTGGNVMNKETKYVRVKLFAPYRTEGTVWWDDVSVTEVGPEFIPPYGWVNEPNAVESIDFGAADDNDPNYHGGIVWNDSSMSERKNDSNDTNITYRELLAGKMLTIEFPAFNLDPGYDHNDPDDMNSLPLGPMLLEIMFKDTVDDNTTTNLAEAGDLVILKSKIDYIELDPNYLKNSNQDYTIARLGGNDDDKWKYMQYGFQKSDFQLIRAIDNKFTIKIENNNDANLPIDYVSLRIITDQEYKDLTEKQRGFRGFYEVVMPADNPGSPSYDDPNLVVFCRDIMRPVYKHTKPGPNEPNSITAFSCWGETEPASFSIYSLGGVNDLTILVSDLTHSEDSNHVIDANKISIYQVIYDETRLGYTMAPKSFALLPDRLEQFTSLSVDPNTSKRIWLKIPVPDANQGKPAGLYEGNVTIERAGEPNVTVAIDFTVYDIDLAVPDHINNVWESPLTAIYSNSMDIVLEAYKETGLEHFGHDRSHRIVVGPSNPPTRPIDPCDLTFDTNNFEWGVQKMKEEGHIIDTMTLYIYYYIADVYNKVMAEDFDKTDANLYSNLSDANFKEGFGSLIEKYIETAADYNVGIQFFTYDEPGQHADRRIICDRLYNLIKDSNYVNVGDPNYKTVFSANTYYVTCDDPCPPGDYNVPTVDGNIPPLTDLVDYKLWAPVSIGYGYARHYDPNDPDYYGSTGGYFGYYTTGHSHWHNPVYNRFLHGLFAFGTDAEVVMGYKMGTSPTDPYNDFDAAYNHILPFTYPDFMYAYPTWSGELLYTIGGLEGIREGIKDAKYIATLKNLIEVDPNAPVAKAAQDYLDEVKSRMAIDYIMDYYWKGTELGYDQAILEDISDTNDPNDFGAFTQIRKNIADYINILIKGKIHNTTKGTWHTTINDAIDKATSGDELVVYQGTYYESIDFDGKAITLRSTNPNDWDVVEATIIDANSDSNNPGRVVTFDDGEDANSVLTGFTITGGYAPGTDNARDGGGIFCYGSSPTISNCLITENYAGDDGGGIFCDSGSDAEISICTVSDNESGDKGGGMYCRDSSPTIKDCDICSNNANEGGGIYCSSSEPQIERCIVSENQTSGGSEADGGGICCLSSNAHIINCIIIDNNSDDDGGGIWCDDGSDPNIINCTFSGNQADDKGGGIYCRNSDPVITNCILWGDTASTGDEIHTSSSSPVVSYSDVEDGWSGTDNIDADPLFDADYHLTSNSPCIDVGDPNGDYDGQVDIDGEDRVIDIAGKGDGNVDVDMGADEFKPD